MFKKVETKICDKKTVCSASFNKLLYDFQGSIMSNNVLVHFSLMDFNINHFLTNSIVRILGIKPI